MHDEPWAHVHDPDEERLAKLSVNSTTPTTTSTTTRSSNSKPWASTSDRQPPT